jgi:hypothetical protein
MALAGPALPAAAATSANRSFFTARPSHSDPNDPATRAYFKLSVSPGHALTDAVTVGNTGDQPIERLVYAVDGLTSPNSGAVYANHGDPVHKAGTWVKIASADVTIPAHSEVPVPFTVIAPPGAAAGDHLAGIAFEDPHPQTSGGQFAITEVFRTVIGVLIQVPGPGTFEVTLNGVSIQAQPGVGTATVVVNLANKGLRLGKPTLTVTLQGPNGYHRTATRDLDTILPGDDIRYPFPWPDSLLPGSYRVSVKADGGAAPASLVSSASVGVRLAGAREAGASPATPLRAKSDRGVALSWAMLLVTGFGGLFVGVAVSRRRQA